MLYFLLSKTPSFKQQISNQHIGRVSESPNYEPFFWANYSGLGRGQPKWFRFRKYSNFPRVFLLNKWDLWHFDRWFCWNHSCLPFPHHAVVLEFKNQAFDMLKKRTTATRHNKKWGDRMVTACYLKVSFWFNNDFLPLFAGFDEALSLHLGVMPLSSFRMMMFSIDQSWYLFLWLALARPCRGLLIGKRSFCLGVEKLVCNGKTTCVICLL